MLDIQVDPLADKDLDFIFDHYAVVRGAPLAAIAIADAIDAAIRVTLPRNPNIGWACETKDFSGRALLVNKSHYIFYQVFETHILIGRIVAALEIRDWANLSFDEIDRT